MSEIVKTSDYSIFKLDPQRSGPHPPFTKRIVNSIIKHDFTPINPIAVNDEMIILDGQERFMACKELDKPIYYTMVKDEKQQ